MFPVCVCIKSHSSEKYKKIVTINGQIYEDPLQEIDDAIPYSPRNLVNDQWMYLENFSSQQFAIDITKTRVSSADFPLLEKKN